MDSLTRALMFLPGAMGLWCSRSIAKRRAGMTPMSSPTGPRLWRELKFSRSFTGAWIGCRSGELNREGLYTYPPGVLPFGVTARAKGF